VLRLLATVATQAYATHAANQRLKRDFRHYVKLAIAVLVILLLVAVGTGFAIAALFLALAQLWGAPVAAALVAALLFVVALLIALFICSNAKPPTGKTQARPAAAAGEGLDDILGEGIEALESAVKRDPKTAVLVALVLGLGVGLIRR
jgi:hypothetical protein